jgi:hypothetical protein
VILGVVVWISGFDTHLIFNKIMSRLVQFGLSDGLNAVQSFAFRLSYFAVLPVY